MRSNVTVGPPIEVLFYQKDSLQPYEWYAELDESHPYLAELRQSWDDNVKSAVEQLPTLDFAFYSVGNSVRKLQFSATFSLITKG